MILFKIFVQTSNTIFSFIEVANKRKAEGHLETLNDKKTKYLMLYCTEIAFK